jgi:hypothetical protein
LQPFGRGGEIEQLEGLLFGSSGTGVVLLDGPQGIVKTILWRTLVGRAEALHWPVLVARCAESEADLAFATLTALIEPVLSQVLPVLSAPRARNLRIALSLGRRRGSTTGSTSPGIGYGLGSASSQIG